MWKSVQFWFRPTLRSGLSVSPPPSTFKRLSKLGRCSLCTCKSTMDAKGTHTVDTTQRLADLRQLLQKHQLQAFVVPTEDQRVCIVLIIRFQLLTSYSDASEYIAHCDQRRAFISGFSGSAGEPRLFSYRFYARMRHRNTRRGLPLHGRQIFPSS